MEQNKTNMGSVKQPNWTALKIRQDLRDLVQADPKATAAEALDKLQRSIFSLELRLPSDTVIYVDSSDNCCAGYLEVYREIGDEFVCSILLFDYSMQDEEVIECKRDIMSGNPIALKAVDFYLQMLDHQEYIKKHPHLLKDNDPQGSGVSPDLVGFIALRWFPGVTMGKPSLERVYQVVKLWDFTKHAIISGCASNNVDVLVAATAATTQKGVVS